MECGCDYDPKKQYSKTWTVYFFMFLTKTCFLKLYVHWVDELKTRVCTIVIGLYHLLCRLCVLRIQNEQGKVTKCDKNFCHQSLAKRWKERESAQESAYFNREDEQAVQRLAAKLRQQIEPSEEILAQQRRGVAEILQKHGVQPNQSLIEDLVRFFH
ncbi:hypothetical protein Gasu2_09730 [Galdieria sulphuraria]|nr:hypothetical protein Gasu2_09730 [Galdieria sulphuraria]